MKTWIKYTLYSFLLAALAIFGIIFDVQYRYLDKINTGREDQMAAEAIMALGASVNLNGTPSDALRDRLLVATDLYKQHKAPKILITGDDGRNKVDEISVMKNYLLSQGVAIEDILIDGQGYRTYESCKRAGSELKLKKIIVVTQRFHISRALYLCNQLGLEAHGATSDLQRYQRNLFFWSRDLLASAAAWWDIHILAPKSPVSE